MKVPELQGSQSSSVGEHMEVLGGWYNWRGHGGSLPLPTTLPYVSFLSGCS